MNREKHHSSPSLVERIFRKYGVRPIDIPAGLIVFNGLLWPEWILVFVFAVRKRPLRYLKIHSIKFQNFHNRLRSWRIYNRLERYTINSANKISSYKWFQRIGKRIGTSSANLTYGTIETIIIYNALLPICWAPINFVSAVTFIQFYRSYINKGKKGGEKGRNDDDNNNGNNGVNGGGNGRNIGNIHHNEDGGRNNNTMKNMTDFLFSVRKHWLGIQPSTICLKIGINDYENQTVYDIFRSSYY